jgi:hypothetical protein
MLILLLCHRHKIFSKFNVAVMDTGSWDVTSQTISYKWQLSKPRWWRISQNKLYRKHGEPECNSESVTQSRQGHFNRCPLPQEPADGICIKNLYYTGTLPYILESNAHPFYSFRGLKNQMRIRIACGLDSRLRAGFWKKW